MTNQAESKLIEAAKRVDTTDRRYRFAKGLFYALISVVAILVLVMSYNQQQANEKTLSVLAGYAKQRTNQIADLQRHIDCITTFFAQPDRANLSITDLESCGFTRSQATGIIKEAPASAKAQTTQVPATSVQPAVNPTPVSSNVNSDLQKVYNNTISTLNGVASGLGQLIFGK